MYIFSWSGHSGTFVAWYSGIWTGSDLEPRQLVHPGRNSLVPEGMTKAYTGKIQNKLGPGEKPRSRKILSRPSPEPGAMSFLLVFHGVCPTLWVCV